MSELVDGQMLAKNLLNNKESDHELPDKISVTNTETPSVRKRKACVLSAEKLTKSLRQGSPRQSLERERMPVPIFLSTEQSLLYPLVPTDSVFQQIWTKPPN